MNIKVLEKYKVNEAKAHEITEAISATVADLGYETVEVEFSDSYNSLNISVYIWHKDGITFDDCEKVHNKVSEILDRYEEEFGEAYCLNVSSQGLDREILTDDDFRRALGVDIEVKGGKSHGILIKYDENTVVIKVGNKEKEYSRQAYKFRPYIKF